MRGQKVGFRHTCDTKKQIAATMKGRAPLAIHIKRTRLTCGVEMGAGNMGRHAPICAAKASTGLFPEKTVAQMKAMRRKLRIYGITPVQYADLWAFQGGVCAICGGDNVSRALAIDHNHRTGEVRGLLCADCNLMLGYAKDKIEILSRAAQYLTEHGEVEPESTDTPEFDPWKD